MRDADLERAIGSLFFRLKQEGTNHASAVSREFGLTGPQCYLMIQLDPAKPVTMVALAAARDCDPSNITGLVDKLEMKGYIQRRPDPKDRRVRMIAVTEVGSKVRTQLLSRPDKKILYRILRDLVDGDDPARKADPIRIQRRVETRLKE
jgi:DNA-binding MarR family transcriptional regulator